MILQDVITLLEEFERHIPVHVCVEGGQVVPELPPEVQRVLEAVYGKQPQDLVPHPYGSRLWYSIESQDHSPEWIKAHAKAVLSASLRYQALFGDVWGGELTVWPHFSVEIAVRNLLGGNEEPEWVLHGGGRWLRLADRQLERVLAQL
jgi:hypothetical protein